MKGNKSWFQTTELIGITGLPKTTQGVNLKAKTEGWTKRKAEGVKGRAYEYHIDSFPKEVQQTLRARNQSLQAELSEQVEMVKIPFYEVYASAGNGLVPIEGQYSPYSLDIHPPFLLDQGMPTTKVLMPPEKRSGKKPI